MNVNVSVGRQEKSGCQVLKPGLSENLNEYAVTVTVTSNKIPRHLTVTGSDVVIS